MCPTPNSSLPYTLELTIIGDGEFGEVLEREVHLTGPPAPQGVRAGGVAVEGVAQELLLVVAGFWVV